MSDYWVQESMRIIARNRAVRMMLCPILRADERREFLVRRADGTLAYMGGHAVITALRELKGPRVLHDERGRRRSRRALLADYCATIDAETFDVLREQAT